MSLYDDTSGARDFLPLLVTIITANTDFSTDNYLTQITEDMTQWLSFYS